MLSDPRFGLSFFLKFRYCESHSQINLRPQDSKSSKHKKGILPLQLLPSQPLYAIDFYQSLIGPLICIKFATQKPKDKKKKGTEAHSQEGQGGKKREKRSKKAKQTVEEEEEEEEDPGNKLAVCIILSKLLVLRVN